MTEFATPPHASPPAAPATARAGRLDMYRFVHKALRRFMSDTLGRLGALDVNDAEERQAVLDSVDSLLAALRSHLQHENDYLHTAIEARRPGGARTTADEHLQHLDSIGDLEDESRALRDAADGQRPQLALSLYRHLAVFVGEKLVHMQVEETRNNAELWALYGDDELTAIHDRLVASVGQAELALIARWSAAALSVPELALLLADVCRKAPPAVFEALLDVARAHLDERRWAQLARALGRPPVPGLVTA